jgi:hypothetical protein
VMTATSRTCWRYSEFRSAIALEVDAIAKPSDAKPYAELLARWRRPRRLFFNIAARLKMDAAPGGKPVQEAIRYLAKIADRPNAKMRCANSGGLESLAAACAGRGRAAWPIPGPM